MSVFFCTSHCEIGCCLVGKERNGTVLSPRRCACNPTKPRMMPSVATNICISIHLPPCFTSVYLRGARKTASFSAKSSPLLTENSPFSRVSSGEVGVSRHVGGKSRLATGKNAGWKKLARRKKNSIFAEVCSACDISFESLRCSPCVAQSFSSRRHTTGDRARTFGVYRALLRRRQPFIPFFPPLQQQFSC